MWDQSGQFLKLIYKSTHADDHKTICFKAHIVTAGRDTVKFDQIAPDNQVILDLDGKQVTWKIRFD